MDTIQLISTLIGNFGFPIVSACYMGWLCFKQQNTLSMNSETLKAISDTLSKLNDRVTEIEHKLDN